MYFGFFVGPFKKAFFLKNKLGTQILFFIILFITIVNIIVDVIILLLYSYVHT
jgi:hypothetical protein